MQLERLYSLIIKDGLRDYKYRNSHLKPVDSPAEENKGAIFTFRTKEKMIHAQGLVMTSLESLGENENSFSHWTPNVYRYGTYTDASRRATKGHSEDNLRQINTFFIDFDDEGMNLGDILNASYDLGFMPTLILKTDKGYQAYFVLENAAYVTAHSQFKVVKVAKAISQNLRNYFKGEGLAVDMTCNHFGIARIPRLDNVEYLQEDHVYSFDEWIQWSMKQSDYLENKHRPNMTVLSGSEGKRQIDEPWFKLLMNESNIKGEKALMGRNNVIFTLSLAYFASGVGQDECQMAIESFNSRLDEPLANGELDKIIDSAYSGKYKAAGRDYILLLCKAWVNQKLTAKDLFITQSWYKFKKPRSQRKNSHFSEWRADLLDYLEREMQSGATHIKATKKSIKEAIGIPGSSLDIILKDLKKRGEIVYRVKKGRGGGIFLASIKTLLLQTLQLKKEAREGYIGYVASLMGEVSQTVANLVSTAQKALKIAKQLTLFEVDIG